MGIMITGRQQHHLRLGRPNERAKAPQRDGRNRLRQRREAVLRAAGRPASGRSPATRPRRRRPAFPVGGLPLIQSDRRAVRPPETGCSDQRHAQQPQNRRQDVALGRGHDAQRQPSDGQDHDSRAEPSAPAVPRSSRSACCVGKLVLFDDFLLPTHELMRRRFPALAARDPASPSRPPVSSTGRPAVVRPQGAKKFSRFGN